MGAGNFLVNLSKAAFNRAGFMTERQMVAATTRAGRYARDVLASGGSLSDELAGSIIRKSLPKGVKAPDLVTLSADKAAEFVASEGSISKEYVVEYMKRVGGFDTVSPRTLKSLVYYNPEFVNENVFSHELRHHLDNMANIGMKLKRKWYKLLLKFPNYQKYSKKMSPIAQEKYTQLENIVLAKGGLEKPHILEVFPLKPTKASLLHRMGVTEEELSTYLSAKVNNLLIGQSTKHKIKLLKEFVFLMQTETNAQRAGAKLSRAIGHLNPNESCRSDMSAVFHEEIMKVLQAELKTQRRNYYKSFLGFKMPKEKYKKAILSSQVGTPNPADLGESLSALNNAVKLCDNSKITKTLSVALADDGRTVTEVTEISNVV